MFIKPRLKIAFGLILFFLIVLFLSKNRIKYEFRKLRKPLEVGSVFDIRLLISPDSHEVTFKSDSLLISGDFFENQTGSPTILLLHGSSVLGRKLELNQVLAQLFYEKGFSVLAIDSRGYGKSEDPRRLGKASDFDFNKDVEESISFLVQQSAVDTSSIYIVGHSFGAGIAIKPFVNDKRIKKAVLIGPPRRYSERFWGTDTLDRNSLIRRKIRDMEINFELELSVYKDVIQNQDIELLLDSINISGKPIFLIDCENEDIKDLEFLRIIYMKIQTPKEYWTVPNVDHYFNTGSFFNYPAYNKDVLENFTSRVTLWLKN